VNMSDFYGPTYLWPTPDHGLRPIGVIRGLGDVWIVGWVKPNGATKRLNCALIPSDDPGLLQAALDRFAAERKLKPALP
jgi:hypothetical protein